MKAAQRGERSWVQSLRAGTCELNERRKMGSTGLWSPSGQLVFEAEQLFRFRHGGVLHPVDAPVVAPALLPHVIAHANFLARKGQAQSAPEAVARGWLGRWCPSLDEVEAGELIAAASKAAPLDRIGMSDFLHFSKADRDELNRAGTVIRQLAPIDESEEDRADRRRLQTADRVAKHREKVAKSRNAALIYSCGVTKNATFAPGAVLAAVVSGAASVPEIISASGHPASAVKPALTRLAKAGEIVRIGRGVYAPAPQTSANSNLSGAADVDAA